MAEEIDKSLEKVSNECVSRSLSTNEIATCCHQLKEVQLKSDEETAKVLQLQYDKEYNILKYIEDKSLIASSEFQDVFCIDCSEEEYEDISDEESEKFYKILKRYDAVPLYNFRYGNMRKVSEDKAGFRIKYSETKVKRLHELFKQKKPQKLDRKESRITVSYGVDDAMRKILYKMMDQQILEEVNDVICLGKQAVILHITVNPHCELPKECAIMMFKTVLPENRNAGRRTIQKFMRSAAEKEMQHLDMLRRAGVFCPIVYGLKGPALLISFLGRNKKLAPKLKDANISEMKMKVAYSQVVHYIQVMYEECKLIHGKLSEYNILWFDNNCYVVDVSECVDTLHKNAYHLLYNDCENISKFFKKRNVADVATPDQLFKDVTSFDYSDFKHKKKKLTEIRDSKLEEES